MVSIRDFSRFAKQQHSTYKVAYLPSNALVALTQDGLNRMESLVVKGEQVEEGQIIAKEYCNKNSEMPSCIHAPIPGIVKDIIEVSLPNGKNSPAVFLEMFGNFTFSGRKINKTDWHNTVSVLRKIKILSEMGVLNTFEKNESLALQVNECVKNSLAKQPLVVRLYDSDCDTCVESFISKEFSKQVLEGAAIIADMIKAPYVIFLSEKGKFVLPEQDFIDDVFREIKPQFLELKIRKYPNGNYKFVYKKASDFLKAKYSKSYEKIFAMNSETCLAVYNAVVKNLPAIDKFVQVQGDAVAKNQILKVRIGTTLRNIFNECGGFHEQPAQIIINGLVKGCAVSDLDTPITQTVRSIFVTTQHGFPRQVQVSCIRCSKCNFICSQGLRPDKIYERYSSGSPMGSTYSRIIPLCNECALCSSVCPSRIPLYQTIKFLKDELKENSSPKQEIPKK